MKKTIALLLFFSSFIFSQDVLKKESKLITENKGVIFIFDSKTCAYCDVLKKDFKNNKQMNELAKNDFNIYLIDKDKEEEFVVGEKQKKETTTTLRMAFAVKSTPNIIMFDKSWNKIVQLPGYTTPEQMIIFMNFVKGINNKKYTVKDWNSYLKANKII